MFFIHANQKCLLMIICLIQDPESREGNKISGAALLKNFIGKGAMIMSIYNYKLPCGKMEKNVL